MPVAANLTFLGIAKETTPGTAVAATNFLPVVDVKPKINVAYLEDNAMRGAMAKIFNEIPGVSFCEYEFGGPAFADVIGWALAGVLGDVATTGASAPFTHAVSLLNSGQPKTYTISDYNGFNTRQFAGCKISEVGLKFAGNGMLEYSAKATGRSFATTSKPTPSFSAVTPQAAWVGVATVAGSASSLITAGDLTIKRSVEPIHNVDGTQSPYDVFAGGDLTVSGSLTAVYEDDTVYANYLNGTPIVLDLDWSQGAGAAATQIKAHMTSAQITDASISRGSGKYVELDLKFDAIANSTDVGVSAGYSPIKATIKNALASGTYV